jgi:hypothetical protein
MSPAAAVGCRRRELVAEHNDGVVQRPPDGSEQVVVVLPSIVRQRRQRRGEALRSPETRTLRRSGGREGLAENHHRSASIFAAIHHDVTGLSRLWSG